MNTKRLFLINLLSKFLPETNFWRLKNYLYRWAGAKIGNNVRICSSVTILGIGQLEIGDDVWIGHDVMIISGCMVKIGSSVDIAPQVLITTGSHKIDITGSRMAGEGTQYPVEIGSGCWICANSTILPNVIIGEKAIIAAGALLNKNANPYTLYAGVPAQEIKKYENSSIN